MSIIYKKRIFLLALAAFMFAGCARKSGSSSATEAIPVGTQASSREAETAQAKAKGSVTITIAVSGELDDELKKQMADFNAEDNGYFIKTKSYTFENNSIDPEAYRRNMYTADFEFLQDILNTDDIDIVYTGSYINSSTYESLKSKGAFIDLYPFMGNDSEVNSATLNSHILELNETDGRLYGVPTFYTLETLVGKKKFVGDKENWTTDEFFAKWENAPSGMTLCMSPYAESTYRTMFRNIEQYVDYDSAEVHFDSEDFRRLLELCGSFPSNNNQKYEEFDWDSVFIMNYCLDSIVRASVFNDNYSYFWGKNDVTLVGFPSSDGCGALFKDSGNRFSICSSSTDEKQRGAWEFIRRFYTYEVQKENALIYAKDINGKDVFSSERGFCLNNTAFDDIAHEIISGKYYSEVNENTDDELQKFQIPTEEDYRQMCRYINETKKWISSPDVELRDIVDAEVMSYLGGGQSLNKTIDIIQNRASVWMSEKT